MNALLKNLPEKFILEIINGPDKGAQFQIMPGDIRIGRGDGNDIVLNDPRCSRDHVILRITNQSVLIENLSENNSLIVDGQTGQKAFVANNSKIMIGTTTFIFRRLGSNLQENKRPSLSAYSGGASTSSSPAKKKLTFYIIVFAALGLGALLMTSKQANVNENLGDITLDEEIESSKKRQEDLIRQQTSQGKNSRQYLDAQGAYLKGIRDFREGLYRSAMTSFSAAIAIYPDHPSARRYYDLSKLKLDEQIQYTIQEGNRYMDQNKYKSAMASYKSAMLLIGDSKNKFYEEARTKYNESVLLQKGSF